MTPLLLLHPLGADGSFWREPAALLGRPCAAPDLPGHGAAPPPAEARLAAFADAVADGLDADRAPVVVVGVSLGGLVAQELYHRHPELVAGLVVADAVATYPPAFRATWPERAAAARAGRLEPLADAMESLWFGERTRAERPELVAEARRVFLATDPEGYARACEALHAADLEPLLDRISVPTLVVCGDDDAPPFVEAAPRIAAGVGDGTLAWLPGGRHAAVLEQPRAFADHVATFLDDHGL